ncbi:DUF2997 domain-containing protein [Phormidesmis priestleyi ULC007]|uniref:DUF2997 domain-containing protein n=1 Tax=Phormidesmis priestleyi ULC007 TaxID=1920490 RepID=A0A2T1DN23_9CYAN|nr:DUF2997 domain-containing protein [Phormidesmis priestleyi]PSB21898.1 DUF2997 domain-containing protein [Phormidesmis priestleyi ULC007]PZO50554.1 MAG: DUF2997 domain-containing protein [Phormidesmis priestleyi]
MADYQTIEYRIGKDGKITERVLNGDTNCTEMTLEIERAIGTVESQKLLPDYYEGDEFLMVEDTQIRQVKSDDG